MNDYSCMVRLVSVPSLQSGRVNLVGCCDGKDMQVRAYSERMCPPLSTVTSRTKGLREVSRYLGLEEVSPYFRTRDILSTKSAFYTLAQLSFSCTNDIMQKVYDEGDCGYSERAVPTFHETLEQADGPFFFFFFF